MAARSATTRRKATGPTLNTLDRRAVTAHPVISSHPVRRRSTHRGAGVVHGVQVERATVRTTWTPGAASARLCLGRRWTGWEPPTHATTGPLSATAPPPSRCRPIPRRRRTTSLASASLGKEPPASCLSNRGAAYGRANLGSSLRSRATAFGNSRPPRASGPTRTWRARRVGTVPATLPAALARERPAARGCGAPIATGPSGV